MRCFTITTSLVFLFIATPSFSATPAPEAPRITREQAILLKMYIDQEIQYRNRPSRIEITPTIPRRSRRGRSAQGGIVAPIVTSIPRVAVAVDSFFRIVDWSMDKACGFFEYYKNRPQELNIIISQE